MPGPSHLHRRERVALSVPSAHASAVALYAPPPGRRAAFIPGVSDSFQLARDATSDSELRY